MAGRSELYDRCRATGHVDSRLRLPFGAEMTPERWSTLVQSLNALTGEALEQAVASHRAEVAEWPTSVRSIGADSPWLDGIFEGRFDPRLELVGHATIQQHLEHAPADVRSQEMFQIVRALAARLDPAFDPPDVVLEEENDIRSAYGCGGGGAWWTRGNATQTIRFDSNATESPSMGMRSHDSWTAHGMAEGCALVVEVDDFFDRRKLTASGPCPSVLEVAPAWAAVVRGADAAEVRRVLRATSVPWRSPGLPSSLLGALFVSEDGRLACRIERGDGVEAQGAPFVITVWAGVGGGAHMYRDFTRWCPATKPSSQYAHDRLGRMQAELGVVGMGDTFSLYVVRRNPDPARFGDKEWIAALPDTPLAELRLFPEFGGSPYTSTDWEWQDGWWYPYSTFRPATAAERAAHASAGR